ncbi:hypothetical protein [Glaciecola petra]|uniref:Porin n=1 Tax=Glaciecola petra TaxID=3075602 RepID=A0ABU2ZTR5_9ALTE|nr:hypothetical protein [Aestuariibacter sp. P117]MDT0596028.1 hypothetical protein [Aestuariibacter sp. P117]
MKLKLCLYLSILFFSSLSQASNLGGRIEIQLINKDSLSSYQQKGTGLLRAENSGLQLQQSFIYGNFRLNKDWTFDTVANIFADGEKSLGITQAAFIYKPLSPNIIKFKARAGFFYPKMSVENSSKGWLSPYTYTQSAINTWIGEELRILGAEVALYSSGRKRQSPWSWDVYSGIFKGNDTTGALLTWRGFATHDRQSLHNDIIQFAPIPSVENLVPYIPTPTYTKPFQEIDGKLGGYIGAHLKYFRTSEFRYYYYDNDADPLIVNNDRLYAWRTKFHSLAYIHNINQKWRILAQYMKGSTLMGANAVAGDYVAWYAMFRYQKDKHSLSARVDDYYLKETDAKPYDPNDNNGTAYTLTYKYLFNEDYEFGIEWHQHNSDVENRELLGQTKKKQQTQYMLVFALNF